MSTHKLRTVSSKTPSDQNVGNNGGSSGGGNEMLEARVARLESHVEHIQRDVSDVKTDVKEALSGIGRINIWMAVATTIFLVVCTIGGWIANNRFDQIIQLISN